MYLCHKGTMNMPYLLISVLWKHCVSFKRYLLKTHLIKQFGGYFFSSDVFHLIKKRFLIKNKMCFFFQVNTTHGRPSDISFIFYA